MPNDNIILIHDLYGSFMVVSIYNNVGDNLGKCLSCKHTLLVFLAVAMVTKYVVQIIGIVVISTYNICVIKN